VTRRKFIALLGGAAAAWPRAARAQQAAMPVVGFLNAASPGPSAPHVAAFREGLKEVGYVEGQNVAIEFRWAEGKNERLHALVADLVNRNVRVIALPGSTPAAHAAKAVTANIPIVFGVGGDPIKLGLVGSLNRPGGNLTGVTAVAVELAPKQLELLHELMPTTTAVAVLVNPTSPALAETTLGELHAATRTRGLQLHVVHASTDSDLDTAFASVANLRVGGLVIGSDAFFTSRAQKLASLATNHRIPAVYWNRDFANAGGLMSYGTSYKETYRIAGIYTGRLLKGERPAELPVQQNAKVELVINIKTAKALGITFPLTLLGRADEVIE
jgi:putative tryptophan/tyrosine transport system substrate-binding protein